MVVTFLFLSSFAGSYYGRTTMMNNEERRKYLPLRDSIGSQKGFLQIYKVLVSPRCMNCHPKGDIPLQGDDSHLHRQGARRGLDGNGVYALKCTNCHQPKNVPGLYMPPGNPKWRLPPSNLKMVFECKSPKSLALQLKDLKRNGNKTLSQLIDHDITDKLVLGGWDPGDGRTLSPLGHEEFAINFKALDR